MTNENQCIIGTTQPAPFIGGGREKTGSQPTVEWVDGWPNPWAMPFGGESKQPLLSVSIVAAPHFHSPPLHAHIKGEPTGPTGPIIKCSDYICGERGMAKPNQLYIIMD